MSKIIDDSTILNAAQQAVITHAALAELIAQIKNADRLIFVRAKPQYPHTNLSYAIMCYLSRIAKQKNVCYNRIVL